MGGELSHVLLSAQQAARVTNTTELITGQTISLAGSLLSLKASWTRRPMAAGSSPSMSLVLVLLM